MNCRISDKWGLKLLMHRILCNSVNTKLSKKRQQTLYFLCPKFFTLLVGSRNTYPRLFLSQPSNSLSQLAPPPSPPVLANPCPTRPLPLTSFPPLHSLRLQGYFIICPSNIFIIFQMLYITFYIFYIFHLHFPLNIVTPTITSETPSDIY